ncbi:MAG: hypothetical protein KDE27_00885 [Planctomycetes bacterium]|nr:hypothetical protein [Planctomycetota bacterium]
MKTTLARSFVLAAVAIATAAAAADAQSAPSAVAPVTAWVTTRGGEQVQGQLAATALHFAVGDEVRVVAPADLLSFHSAAPANEREQAAIAAALPRLDDPAAGAAAAAELVEIGLPVLTPLLDSYPDLDGHQPDTRYRLFERLIPGFADARDRSLDLVRLRNGETLRAHWQPAALEITTAAGKRVVAGDAVRRLAIRQARCERSFELQAMRHCTYVSWLDTGLAVTPSSKLVADARGYVRLSFAEDGWATGPDGILEPLPGKRKLQEGFRWGSVLYGVGVGGERRFAGSHLEAKDLGDGRLYFVINDNEHWQNNIGSYRVHLTATDAFDLGEPQ